MFKYIFQKLRGLLTFFVLIIRSSILILFFKNLFHLDAKSCGSGAVCQRQQGRLRDFHLGPGDQEIFVGEKHQIHAIRSLVQTNEVLDHKKRAVSCSFSSMLRDEMSGTLRLDQSLRPVFATPLDQTCQCPSAAVVRKDSFPPFGRFCKTGCLMFF